VQKLAFERCVRAPIALAAGLCLAGSQWIWLPCAFADPDFKTEIPSSDRVRKSNDRSVTAAASPLHKPDSATNSDAHSKARSSLGPPGSAKSADTHGLPPHRQAQSKAASSLGKTASIRTSAPGSARSADTHGTSALHTDAQSKNEPAQEPPASLQSAKSAKHKSARPSKSTEVPEKTGLTSKDEGTKGAENEKAEAHDQTDTNEGWYTPPASLKESANKTEPKNNAPGKVETLKTDDSAKPAATTAGSQPKEAKTPELKSETPLLAPLPINQPDTVKPPPPATTTTAPIKNPPGEDNYPAVAKMETLTFGAAQPTLDLQERLTKLEQAVFQQTFADATLFDRTEKLKKTLLGGEDEFPPSDINHSASSMSLLPFSQSNAGEVDYFDSMAARPENHERVTKEALVAFALAAINYERAKAGANPLELDEIACKVAKEHVEELCRRNIITHNNMRGDNPDRRFTVAGGDGAMVESIIANKTPDTLSQSPTKAAVINVLKQITSRQDDKDAVFNPEATKLGFAIDWTPGKDKVIAVTEIITNHGIIHPLPLEARVGEKLEIKGVVLEPYKFEKVTLAWEANHEGEQPPIDDPDEAMPYFPPLDYVAYAGKSEHDYSTAMGTLRTVGIIAAIAGGMFIPPVALAAPVIAMSGSMGNSEPKPASDIPVHGGMKTEGSTFSGKITLNKDGKEGIYYVTVWASNGKYTKAIPISRQAVIARGATEDVTAKVEGDHEKKSKKEKKEKKENQASAQP